MNMQKVTSWAKANWLIIVSCVVLVTALVVGPLFGSRMTKKIGERVRKEVEADHSALSRDKVSYTVPDPARPGEALITQSMPPHPEHTKSFKALRERLKEETSRVWADAAEFNRNGHELLVEGLFPKPSVANERVLPNELAEAYILRAHQDLLRSIGAGMPPEPAKVLTDLQTHYDSQTMRIVSSREGNELTFEEKAAMTEELQRMRLGKYSQRASEVSVYADVTVFNLPPLPSLIPTLTQCWDWQVRYWIHKDIVQAVAKANQMAPSGDGGVPGAVVKRLVNVLVEESGASAQTMAGGVPPGVDPHSYLDPYAGGYTDPYAQADPAAGGEGAAVAEETGPDIAPRDYHVSVTGRTSGEGTQNKHYDVRYVNVVAIVSTERLPVFMDALAQTNFMTVVDLDLKEINPAEHLDAGFYYGSDPVVEASMRIETLWFREWTKALMPTEVRESRGIPAPVDAPSAPAPAPRQPAGDGDDLLGPG